MTNLNSPILQDAVQHVNFFNGRLLTAADMRDEQLAHRRQRQLLGQAAGAGVVYGLEVRRTTAKRVEVTAGLAINRLGQPLLLPNRSEINLVAEPPSDRAAPDFLIDCEQPAAAESPGETDVYLLVIAPAAGYTGSAPMHTLSDEGRLNGCGKRYAVDAVTFRLARFNEASMAGLSDASRAEITTLLRAANPSLAQRSRLRNLLAHFCFGTEELAAFGRDPFRRKGQQSAYWQYGGIDALHQNGRLTECETPLALIHLTAMGVQMIDLWAARRRAATITSSDVWPTAVADRRAAEAEAVFLQFQAHLEEIVLENPAAASTIMARAHFRYLPPAGLLRPGVEDSSITGVTANRFFHGYPTRTAGPLDGGRLQALLRESYNYPPIDLDKEEPARVYKPPSHNPPAGDDEVYVLFTTVRLPPLESMADDLRHHNKHLHGWGIVCGLQAVCGPDDNGGRRHVTVRDGYAIDCDGNNLILSGPKTVDVMAAIEELAAQDPNNPPLKEGKGEVCLTLALDEEGRAAVGVERYTPEERGVQSLLQGTLLMDFYERCIKGLVEAVKAQFTPQPDEANQLVGPTRKRLIAFMNLAVQLLKPEHGGRVYLSPQEDEILRTFYLLLRSLLQSSTFCAMFDQARPFPDYPFAQHKIHTIFGKGVHSRLRLHPGGQLACTLGADNRLYLYDLQRGIMIAAVTPPQHESFVVQDVAFSPDGKQIYIIGNSKNQDSILAAAAIADPQKGKLDWQLITVWKGRRLRRLAICNKSPKLLYAVGDGAESGLFTIDLGATNLVPNLVSEFTPTPHLVIDQESGLVFAGAQRQSRGSDAIYDSVHAYWIENNDGQTYPLIDQQGNDHTGQDDILAANDPETGRPYLFVVVARSGGLAGKGVLQLISEERARPEALIDLGEETEVRLGHIAGSGELLVSLEDSFRLRQINIAQSFLREDFHLPVQISPLSLAVAPDRAKVYVLNSFSMSLTSIPTSYLVRNKETEGESARDSRTFPGFSNLPGRSPGVVKPAPGSQEFLDSLEKYRRDALAAFVDLLGGLLQYLKDCLCDHLLVNCPDCDPVEPIYLACVSVRDNQVRQVCNFSRRKYVKSFPTVEYWLSLIPLAPLVKQLIVQLCCAALPDTFGEWNAPEEDGLTIAINGSQMREGIFYGKEVVGHLLNRLNMARDLASDWVAAFMEGPVQSGEKGAAQQEFVGQDVEMAVEKMAGLNITAEVVPYDPSRVRENLSHLLRSPAELRPGSRVRVYEEDGVARFIALVGESAAVIDRAAVREAAVVEADRLNQELIDQQERIKEMETELENLRQFREEVRVFMERN